MDYSGFSVFICTVESGGGPDPSALGFYGSCQGSKCFSLASDLLPPTGPLSSTPKQTAHVVGDKWCVAEADSIRSHPVMWSQPALGVVGWKKTYCCS